MSIEATRSTRCPACDEQIEVGDLIELNEDEEWVHERCNDDG